MDKNFIQFLVISYGTIEFPKMSSNYFKVKCCSKVRNAQTKNEPAGLCTQLLSYHQVESKLNVDLNVISEYGINMKFLSTLWNLLNSISTNRTFALNQSSVKDIC